MTFGNKKSSNLFEMERLTTFANWKFDYNAVCNKNSVRKYFYIHSKFVTMEFLLANSFLPLDSISVTPYLLPMTRVRAFIAEKPLMDGILMMVRNNKILLCIYFIFIHHHQILSKNIELIHRAANSLT